MKKTSAFQNSLIWFGAAVSIAEILTGTYFAPLGFTKGLLAILVGHVIGCAMFFFAGLIGGRTGRSAMGTVELSFGRIGCLFFAALNVLQLVGWTAIMIYDGALATNTVLGIGKWVWCLVIGGLVVVWIAVGIKNLGWVNKIAMAALFILSIVLCVVVFRGGTPVTVPDDSLSFGAAVELAVAMPLSWLPLISDYTREAEKPFAATLSSTLTYGVVSCWMYVIGMAPPSSPVRATSRSLWSRPVSAWPRCSSSSSRPSRRRSSMRTAPASRPSPCRRRSTANMPRSS